MQLNLISYQLKMAYYNYKMFHVSLIITKRKVTVDTKKKKRKELRQNTRGNHLIIKKEKDLQNIQKTYDKIAVVSTYIAVINLNANVTDALSLHK